jgi:hypothetical protein
MATIFVLLFLAAVAGIIRPYIKGAKRWHFGLAAFVCFVVIGVTAPDPEKKQTDTPPSSATAASQKKGAPAKTIDHSDTVNSFQSSVLSSMKPCDNSSQALANVAVKISDGRASVYDGYSAASDAEDNCRESWSAVSKLDAPKSLPAAARDKANETLERCEGAMLAKQMAAEKMAEIFDGNMRPSTVQEAKELAEGSQAGILACAAGFFLIASEAGVDIKQLKFDE